MFMYTYKDHIYIYYEIHIENTDNLQIFVFSFFSMQISGSFVIDDWSTFTY